MQKHLQTAREVLWQTGKDMFTDNAFQWSAAISYYAMLSVFPLLLAAVSLSAYFVEPQWATERITSLIGEFVPKGEDRVQRVVESTYQARGTVSFLSVGLLLWTGSRVFGALIRALNVAYDTDETYNFWQRLGVEMAFLCSAGALFLLAMLSKFLFAWLWSVLQWLPAERGAVFNIVKNIVAFSLLLGAYFLIYRFVPRGGHSWKSAFIGALSATILFLLARPLFFHYVQSFAEYNLVYGSLAVVIVLMVWAWVVSVITLFGGELASHIQMMVFEGHAAHEVEKRHLERSPHRKDAS